MRLAENAEQSRSYTSLPRGIKLKQLDNYRQDAEDKKRYPTERRSNNKLERAAQNDQSLHIKFRHVGPYEESVRDF